MEVEIPDLDRPSVRNIESDWSDWSDADNADRGDVDTDTDTDADAENPPLHSNPPGHKLSLTKEDFSPL